MKVFFTKSLEAKHINQAAIGNNLLLYLMYRVAYPFALLFNSLRLTPNQLTTISCGLAVGAAASLLFSECALYFSIFWALAVLLDFCDGTVARMSGTVGKTAFRYDHNSDIWKLFLIILCASIRYDDLSLWIVSTSSIAFFLYYTTLNHDLAHARKNQKQVSAPEDEAPEDEKLLRERFAIIGELAKNERLFNGVKVVYTIITNINGHTLLVFFLLPLGETFALSGLGYFAIISLMSLVSRIRSLQRLRKV